MALDILEAKLKGIRTSAEMVQNEWNQEIAAINSDGSLSDVGKSANLGEAYTDVKSKLDGLRAQEHEAVKTKRTELEKDVFGLYSTDSTAIISYRDARDRARRLEDSNEAESLMQSAELSADDALASAILAEALDRGWSRIISTYKENHPSKVEKLKDLSTLAKYQGNSFTNNVAYMVMQP